MSAKTVRPPSMPRMPWYPSDFHGATRGWPLVARAIYRELLDAEWDLGDLPNDEDILRRIADTTRAEWRVGWPLVSQKFVLTEGGKLRNLRLQQHREIAINLWQRRSAGAEKTNRSRYGHGTRVVALHGDDS